MTQDKNSDTTDSKIIDDKGPDAKNTKKGPPKKKGPLRTEAVVPFIIVAGLTWAYFFFFFDTHLRKAIEYLGYNLIGAQVDVGSLRTSFADASFRIRDIQITNSQKPTHNMLEVGDIRFGVLWDGLLRAKIIINEMAVEQIAIDTKRSSPGKVKPPEPEGDSSGSSAPSAAEEAKGKALQAVQEGNENNVLANLVSMISGSSAQAEVGKIEGQLESKQRLQTFEKALKDKTKVWEEKFKSLPKPKEVQEISERISKVKTKDFKSPEELKKSLGEIDKILKEADAKFKDVQKTGSQLQSELTAVENEYKELQSLIQKDIKELENKFKIPSLDAKSISMSIFRKYAAPYQAQAKHYTTLYKKYAPPNLVNKDAKEDSSIKPHKREKGLVYEFPRSNSYPLFWIKRILVSSKPNKDLGTGALEGRIDDITSNQKLINQPTVAKFKGDFPGLEIYGIDLKLVADFRPTESLLELNTNVKSFKLNRTNLIESNELNLGFDQANGSSNSKISISGFRTIKGQVQNTFDNIKYSVESKNSESQKALSVIFNGLPPVTMDASLTGTIPSIDLNLDSNIGPEIEKSFRNLLNARISEAQAQIKAFIDKEIGATKASIEKTIEQQKKIIDGEVKKLTDQINAEKSKGEAKVNQTKKDAENQAKKGVESELKKALGNDGSKKLDDLKKKFGL